MHQHRGSTHPRRPRARWWSVGLMAGALAVGTSGCTLLPVDTTGGASTQTLADGSSFLVGAQTNIRSDAGVTGTLALIGGDCVGIQSPGGDGAALNFPHGTHPSEDGRRIVLPDGLQITLGDAITGGGGFATLSQAPDAFADWPDAPTGCGKGTYLATIYGVSIDEAPQG